MKLQNIKRLCLGFAIVLLGCEHQIELPDYERKLVVEGYIEQGRFPVVYLTYSSSYYSPIDSSAFLDLVEGSARVKVSDGEETEVLIRFSNGNIFPTYVYEGRDIRGEVGKTYYLEVISRGDTVTATTTIPEPAEFDSLWYELSTEHDSRVNIWARLTDNYATENYYRFFTRVKGHDTQYYPTHKSVIRDAFFQGESFELSLLRGAGNTLEPTFDAGVFFDLGDTVDVRLTTMDNAHFEFWNDLEREQYLALSPFSSAGNDITSNLHSAKGQALGVWGGYGASYYRIVLQ